MSIAGSSSQKKAPYNAFIDALVAERGLSRVSPLKPNRLMTLSELLAAIRRDRDFDNSQSATPKTPEQMRAAEANTQWAVTGLVGPYAETLGAEAAPVISRRHRGFVKYVGKQASRSRVEVLPCFFGGASRRRISSFASRALLISRFGAPASRSPPSRARSA